MLGMNKEVVTDPLVSEDLWTDLKLNVAWLNRLGISDVLLFFGYSWGNAIYEDQWEDIPVSITSVEEMVADAEQKEYGRLGNDNLYITVPGLNAKLLYGHEADIHLSYAEKNDFVHTILARWEENGWLIYVIRKT